MANGATNGNGKSIVLWRAIEILLAIIVTVNIGLTTWALNKVVNLSVAVAAMQSNRFTSKDGLEVWKEMAVKADKKDVPPPEVLRRLADLEQDQHSH